MRSQQARMPAYGATRKDLLAVLTADLVEAYHASGGRKARALRDLAGERKGMPITREARCREADYPI